MPLSQDAPLSPREEITLRRVALGIADPNDLSQQDLRRLKRLSLVVDVEGHLELTSLGRKRYHALPRAMEIPDDTQGEVVVTFENYVRRRGIR